MTRVHTSMIACLLLIPASASAVTLTLQSEEAPYTGVTLQTYRTSSPDTDTHVVRVDLCAAGVHVESTMAPDGLQTAGSWADDVGAQVAINGDFYATSPTRVYGHAVGGGLAWPLDQTGRDPGYASEWYADKYGYVAFGHDWVDFTPTEQVKNQGIALEGYGLTEVGVAGPPGALSLVSGFPQLVIDGVPVDCSSPTDSSCFPDRTDMRSRHPRSAMGLSADRQELILVAVDGRTSASDGMYGEELADLMGQLGAHTAFNLDGGGSTQLWLEDRGYVNDASGNNFGGGVRSVANHWGIRAEGTGRPGHCEVEPACALLPPTGGVIDDDSSCFRTFGNPVYWREEAAGHGGHLFWTNAWDTDQPENWAWWQVQLQDAGEYEVEVYVDPAFGVFGEARYEVVAADATYDVLIDQGAASGWVSLGVFPFDAGGRQHVAVFDDHDGWVGSDQHVVADALRLTRTDLPEEPEPDPDPEPEPMETADTGVGDSGLVDTGWVATDEPEEPTEPGEAPTTTGSVVPNERQPTITDDQAPYEGMSGCSTSGAGGGLWLALLTVGYRRRYPRGV
jgi:hypothetical protein